MRPVPLEITKQPVGRRCGSCQLCCTLLPVKEGFFGEGINIPTFVKPAGTRCQHARFRKGCSIYERRPWSCQEWSCDWLTGNLPEGLPRPDRAGYVVDPAIDKITYVLEDDPEHPIDIPVKQIWIDPKRLPMKGGTFIPDKALENYISDLADQGIGVIFREGSREGYVIFRLNGQWHQGRGTLKPGVDQLNDAFTAYIR